MFVLVCMYKYTPDSNTSSGANGIPAEILFALRPLASTILIQVCSPKTRWHNPSCSLVAQRSPVYTAPGPVALFQPHIGLFEMPVAEEAATGRERTGVGRGKDKVFLLYVSACILAWEHSQDNVRKGRSLDPGPMCL